MTSEDFNQKYGFSLEYLKADNVITSLISSKDTPHTRKIVYNDSRVYKTTVLNQQDTLLLHLNSIRYLKGLKGYKINLTEKIFAIYLSNFVIIFDEKVVSLYTYDNGYKKKDLNLEEYQELFNLSEDVRQVIEEDFNAQARKSLRKKLIIRKDRGNFSRPLYYDSDGGLIDNIPVNFVF